MRKSVFYNPLPPPPVPMLHDHQDEIDLMKVGNAFVEKFDERLRSYGHFTLSDFEK